ncbi:hypothetical protein AURDEDRAFT_176126 [Auricularia subglabra TFB-10046 SS5]|uniref:Uncharacterized protein n=1 Tax=Auricularia subglabra (strain TFB-10046 / SS5) TaxID=717982 RepID=J0LDR1_AURST|nr:hypothetical protein AURDEDRAFT_176126 [Auricularia subglabra TFB-10046 SS5]
MPLPGSTAEPPLAAGAAPPAPPAPSGAGAIPPAAAADAAPAPTPPELLVAAPADAAPGAGAAPPAAPADAAPAPAPPDAGAAPPAAEADAAPAPLCSAPPELLVAAPADAAPGAGAAPPAAEADADPSCGAPPELLVRETYPYDGTKNLKDILVGASALRKLGGQHAADGDLENAFICYARAAAIVVQRVSTHELRPTLSDLSEKHQAQAKQASHETGGEAAKLRAEENADAVRRHQEQEREWRKAEEAQRRAQEPRKKDEETVAVRRRWADQEAARRAAEDAAGREEKDSKHWDLGQLQTSLASPRAFMVDFSPAQPSFASPSSGRGGSPIDLNGLSVDNGIGDTPGLLEFDIIDQHQDETRTRSSDRLSVRHAGADYDCAVVSRQDADDVAARELDVVHSHASSAAVQSSDVAQEEHDAHRPSPTNGLQAYFRTAIQVLSSLVPPNFNDNSEASVDGAPFTIPGLPTEAPIDGSPDPDVEAGLLQVLAAQHAAVFASVSRRFPPIVPCVTVVGGLVFALVASGMYLTDPAIARREKEYALIAVSFAMSILFASRRRLVPFPRYENIVAFVAVVIGELAALGAAALHLTDPLATRREKVYVLLAASVILFLSLFPLLRMTHN